jgi:hypothetical protein
VPRDGSARHSRTGPRIHLRALLSQVSENPVSSEQVLLELHRFVELGLAVVAAGARLTGAITDAEVLVRFALS